MHVASEPNRRQHSVFLPSLLMAIAIVGWLAFQSIQHWSERQQLATIQVGLDMQEQSAIKLRASLDALASATAKLADSGNANARVIVEELRKRGVTINAGAAGKGP